MSKNKDRGPQGEPLSDELRAALPHQETAVVHYGPQGEVIQPDSIVVGGTDRDNVAELFVDARYSPFSMELCYEGGQTGDPQQTLRCSVRRADGKQLELDADELEDLQDIFERCSTRNAGLSWREEA